MTQLGQKVTFIRQLSDGTVGEGVGIVKAIHLDNDVRLSAFLDIGGQGINVPMAALNPTEEFKVKFREFNEQFRVIETEGRDKNAAIVVDYNGRLAKLTDEMLGQAVTVEQLPEQSPIQAPQAELSGGHGDVEAPKAKKKARKKR